MTGLVGRPSQPEQKSHKTLPKTRFVSATSENVPMDWIVGQLEDGRQRVVCPDGSQHATRREALKYMVDKGFPENDINIMRSFLKAEGWEDNEKLPPNWKYKIKTDQKGTSLVTRKYLMAANGRTFDTIASAVRHMEGSQWYSQAEISQVQSIAHGAGEKGVKFDTIIDWKDDITVPSGWKVGYNQEGKQTILCRDGTKFSSRRDALRYLVSKGFPEKEVDILRSHLKVEGWEGHEKLPQNWKMKIRSDKTHQMRKFLMNSKGIMFNTIAGAVRFMEQDKTFTDQEIAAVQSISANIHEDNSTRYDKTIDWKEDDTVPSGWKVGYSQGKQRVLCHNGATFPSRREALKYMISKDFPETEVNILRSHLKFEGWEDHEKLPHNWKIKIRTDLANQARKFLMNSSGIMFNTIIGAAKFMEQEKTFSEQEIADVQSICNDSVPKVGQKCITSRTRAATTPEMVASFTWRSDDPSVPKGWKVAVKTARLLGQPPILSPELQIFPNRRQALKNMVSTGAQSEKIDEMRYCLSDEGWKDDLNLPLNWKVKLKANEKKVDGKSCSMRKLIMSASGKLFDSIVAAVRFMETSKEFSEFELQDVRNMAGNTGNTGGSHSRDGKLDIVKWNKDDKTVPAGWKLGHSKDGLQRLQSPDGSQYASRREALKHMVEAACPEDQIRGMRAVLEAEGWKDHDKLPQDWKLKMKMDKHGKNRKRKLVMAPSGKYFDVVLNAVRWMEKSQLYDQITIDNVRSIAGGLRIKTDSEWTSNPVVLNAHTWLPDSATVPPGWKVAGESNDQGSILILSPEEQAFPNRREAIKYMLANNLSAKKVEEMRECLMHEGWIRHPELPDAWRVKKKMTKEGKNKGLMVLTPMAQHFSCISEAFKHMAKNPEELDEETTELMQRKDLSLRRYEGQGPIQPNRMNANNCTWVQDDPTVPKGWKIGTDSATPGKLIVESPEGDQFTSRRRALRHMIEADFWQDDIEEMRSCLVEEGWDTHPELPKNWRVKENRDKKGHNGGLHVLTPNGKFHNSIPKAIKFMKQFGQCDEETMKLFDRPNIVKRPPKQLSIRKSQKLTVSKQMLTNLIEDPTLPSGWRIGTHPSQPDKTKIVSPDGLQFSNRREILKWMVDNGSPEDEREEVLKWLVHEGWQTHPGLPADWRVKIRQDKDGKNRQLVLAPNGKVYQTIPQAFSAMKKTGLLDDKAITMVQKLYKPRPWAMGPRKSSKNETEIESIPSTWLEGDNTVPEGWKVAGNQDSGAGLWWVCSPDGVHFKNRRLALKHMIKDGSSEDRIEEMRGCLAVEGWMKDDHLPKDWRLKVKAYESYSRNLVMSSDGCLFSGVSVAVRFMTKTGNYSVEDIENVREILKNARKERKEKKSLEKKLEKKLEKQLARKTVSKQSEQKKNNKTKKVQLPTHVDISVLNWKEDDPTVPKGWKTGSDQNKAGSLVLLSPDGTKFISRRRALTFMIGNGFPDEEIESMRDCLGHEGWKAHPELPPTWRVKKQGGKSTNTLALTPSGKTFKSILKAFKYLQNSGGCDSETIDAMKSRISNKQNKLKRVQKDGSSTMKLGTSRQQSKINRVQNDGSLEKRVGKKQAQADDEHIWIMDDPTVPEGWETASDPKKPGSQVIRLSKCHKQHLCKCFRARENSSMNRPVIWHVCACVCVSVSAPFG